MENASLVMLAQEAALRRRMEVVANNIANMSTAGFRREAPAFEVLPQQNRDADRPDARNVAFVADRRILPDLAAGRFTPTGNPLDVMVQGDGWLSYQASDGTTAYSRNGQLTRNDEGQLVNASGNRLLDTGGQPITIPAGTQGEIAIGADGRVTAGEAELGRIAIYRVDSSSNLTPRGDGLYDVPSANVDPDGRLQSGGFESANVEPVRETTAMIEIMRHYQAGQKLAEAQDQLRRQAIERLGRSEP